VSSKLSYVGALVGVGVIVYGCSGSSVEHRAHPTPVASGGRSGAGAANGGDSGAETHAGAPANGAKGGSGGTAGTGAHGGTAGKGGRGGSAGRAGGGRGGSAGKGGRGGTAGTVSSGAGAGNGSACVPFETGGNGSGGENCGVTEVDACCVGHGTWDTTSTYYATSQPACGDSRTCELHVCVQNGCQDTSHRVYQDLRCCTDDRWHVVTGNSQYVINADDTWSTPPLGSPLSPPCGGTALPSAHALHFDGGSSLELPVHGSARHVELWFRTSTATGPLLSSTTSAHTLYLEAGHVCYYPDSSGGKLCSPEAGLANGQWHHAAYSADYTVDDHVAFGGLYVDGTLRAPDAPPTDTAPAGFTAGYGHIGASPDFVYFTGDLDEIRVWRAGRDAIAILDYYQTRFTDERMFGRLLGYWPLEEGGSATATANQAGEPIVLPPYCDESHQGGAGAGGAPAAPPQGRLNGFGGSPWIDGGAF
jgi:hypothetical protein